MLDRRAWTPLPVFGYIASHGRVARAEMEKAFNMGVGMVAVLPADDVDRAMAMLTARHVRPGCSARCGAATTGSADARLAGAAARRAPAFLAWARQNPDRAGSLSGVQQRRRWR